MDSKAKEQLEKRIIVNAFNEKYPTSMPSTNTLKHHLRIYELIDEYNSLVKDMKNASCPTTKLIEPRLSEIESELMKFWIVRDEDMVREVHEEPPKKKK